MMNAIVSFSIIGGIAKTDESTYPSASTVERIPPAFFVFKVFDQAHFYLHH